MNGGQMEKEYKNHFVLRLIALAVGAMGVVLFRQAWTGSSEPGLMITGGMRYVVGGLAILLMLGPVVFWTERLIASEDGIVWYVMGWHTSIRWEEIQRLSWQKLLLGIGFYHVTTDRTQPFRGKTITLFSLMPGCQELKRSIIERAMLTQVSKSGWNSTEMYDRLTEPERLRLQLQSRGAVRV